MRPPSIKSKKKLLAEIERVNYLAWVEPHQVLKWWDEGAKITQEALAHPKIFTHEITLAQKRGIHKGLTATMSGNVR